MTSRYSAISPAPLSELHLLTKAYEADNSQEKVNLSIQTYCSESGKPIVFPLVRRTEIILSREECPYRDHLPILGSVFFTNLVTKLVIGSNYSFMREQRCFSIQTPSLVGALRIAAEFLIRIMNYNIVYVAKPALKSHKQPFIHSGFIVREYRYWNQKTRELHFQGMKNDIRKAPQNAVIIFQACGHNPTGYDLSDEQWTELADIIESRNLFPCFVNSFQGIISGDLDVDASGIRIFAEKNIELFSTQSYEAKFGLYCERTGNLTVVLNDAECFKPLQSQFAVVIKAMYSNPSYYGVKLIRYILENSTSFQEWKSNLKDIANRVNTTRKALKDALDRLNTPGDWNHIISQNGFFCLLGLNRKQVIYIVKNKHIYLFRSGRINLSAINKYNVDYIARAINETITFIK